MYDATMHVKWNQYIEFDGDHGHVETWVVTRACAVPASAARRWC